MKRRESFLPAFLVVAILCAVILVLSLAGKLNFLSSFLEKGTSGVQKISFGFFRNLPFVSEDLKIKRLKEENLELLSRVSDFEKLKRENAALSDQFQTSYPASSKLLEAQIIGAPSFVPGVSIPSVFILNKGAKDNVQVGSGVIIKDNLVGLITQVSDNLSKVNAINNSSSSFTVKTQNGANGIIKGGGGGLTLNNVLMLENLKKGELVLTKGDIMQDGTGIPPDLIVGEITEIEKNPSDLFQKAKIESFVDFTTLSTVFIYINN